MKSKKRNLGAIEKVFWLLDQVSQVHFCLAAEIETVCSEAEWRLAIDATQHKHPLLSAKICGADDVQPYFDFSTYTKIPIRGVVGGNNRMSWMTEMETELAMPFDWSIGPLMRAVIVTYPTSTVIVIAAHHCIADGLGISFVIRDIVAALSSVSLVPMPIPPSPDEQLKLAELLVTETRGYTSGETSIQRHQESRPQVFEHTLSETFTTAIIDKVKQKGSTVNAILSAALVVTGKKLAASWKNNQVRLVVPVSIRQALGIAEDCGLYITKKTIGFQPDELDLWTMASKVNAEISGINSPEAVAAETAAIRQLLFSPMGIQDISNILQADVGREIMVSNIGRTAYPTQIGTIKINAMWGPIALSGSSGDQTVGIATINGKMHLLQVSRIPIPGLLTATVDVLKEQLELFL